MLRRLRIENLVLIREAELVFAPGLNAITGETGAGKTILAQAIGLLLGARGEAGMIGSGGAEAYVEAELDLPEDLLQEEAFEALAGLQPEGELELVLARRIFADGRTRAYAWGRSIAREDLAFVAERLLAMSGQFEQRRLARPSYQLDALDAFAAEGQLRRRADARRAWRTLIAARRAFDELRRDSESRAERLGELRALVADTSTLESGIEEDLRAERERLRHAAELVEAASGAADAIAPEEGEGAAGLVARAERLIAPLEHVAPELVRPGEELRDAELRLRELVHELRSFLASLEGDPSRLDELEGRLEEIGDLKRRYRAESLEELLGRRDEARIELDALDEGLDPDASARGALTEAEAAFAELVRQLSEVRAAAAGPMAEAIAAELRSIGLGDGEFRVVVGEREQGLSGADEVSFLIRPNAGLPFVPVAEAASGGELSRIALAIAAVGGGETIVFDEIDAGIGGRTAHAVGEALGRLAQRSQVLTITHLPQIASLADRHFRVEKVPGDPTHTSIEPLEEDERRRELERMLGGQEFLASVAGTTGA